MSFGTNRCNKKPWSYFTCTAYRQFGKMEGKCTAHYIRYDFLYAYILSQIQRWSRYARANEQGLLD